VIEVDVVDVSASGVDVGVSAGFSTGVEET